MKRLLLGLAAFWLACLPTLAAKKPVPPPMDVAFIVNTGSTNTTGYRVDVFTDGTCGIENNFTRGILSKINQMHPNRSAFNAFEEGKLPVSVEQKFFRDVLAAMPLTKLPVNHTFKSVSFGTSTYVEYKGQQTPDLSSPADARGQALTADVRAITAALGLKNLPRRPVGPMTPLVPGH